MFDPNNNETNFKSIIKRLKKANWITEITFTTPDEMVTFLTPLGKEKLEQIKNLINTAFPEDLPIHGNASSSPLEILQKRLKSLGVVLKFMDDLRPIVADLQDPPIGVGGEADTLLTLLAAYALKTKEEPPPVHRPQP
jgi:hypothetical protein